jgi:hypothetical protein
MKNVSPNPLKLLSLHLSEMETLRLESNYNCKSENCIVACYKYYYRFRHESAEILFDLSAVENVFGLENPKIQYYSHTLICVRPFIVHHNLTEHIQLRF